MIFFWCCSCRWSILFTIFWFLLFTVVTIVFGSSLSMKVIATHRFLLPGTRCHKERKHSLKKWVEWAVLLAYVEGQAVLEPILLHRVSNSKQTKKRTVKAVCAPSFLPFYVININFLFFFRQDANMPRWNCVQKGSNSWKKHKLVLYQTQVGGSDQ